MPTNHDYIQKWLDDMFNPNYDPFAELEKIARKCGIEVDNKKQTITVKNPVSPFEIQSVLSNRKKNAFTVVWTDGTHTTVHCQSGDNWDDEKALAMCFTKKALGNKGNFNDKFNDALDNKMKVIPADPAPEKACNCDGTCEVCECKANPEVKAEAEKFIEEIEALKKRKNAFGLSKETADELTKATVKANHSLKEMINALTGETEKPEIKEYKVFVKANGAITPAGTYHDAKSTTTRVKELATEHFGRKPYYYRCWMEGDKMVIDFGSYSKFIVIQGMTPDEWVKD